MSPDATQLLALLAVRMAGPDGLDAKAESAKAIKKLLDAAVKDGLLTGERTVPTPTAKDPNKAKTVKAYSLTPAGNEALAHAASHEKTVAEEAGHRAAAKGKVEAELRKESESLLKKLDADRESLKKKLTDALPKKPPAADPAKVQKQLDDVSKALAGLADKVAKLQTAMAGGADPAALAAKIEEAFASLSARVPVSAPAAAAIPTPAAVTPPAPAVKPLAEVLRQAYYDKVPFAMQGLVELPKLFHRAKELHPALTVEAFHRELDTLWNDRHVELHILNEVATAKEPDKAMRRHDKFYYYVLWKPS